MAIPDFQTIMLPLLQFAGDEKEHSIREAVEALALTFKLTGEERRESLPSGRQGKFANRVHWAKLYAGIAGLLDSPKRGVVKISQRGLDVLEQNPDRIDMNYLKRFPEYVAWRKGTAKNSAATADVESIKQETPIEAFGSSE